MCSDIPQNVELIGTEQKPRGWRGEFGHPHPYTEELVVAVDGNERRVPLTTIRTPQFPCYGNIPEVVNVDRVFYDPDADELRAEADTRYGGGVEFRMRDGRWVCHQYGERTAEPDAPKIWPNNNSRGREDT